MTLPHRQYVSFLFNLGLVLPLPQPCTQPIHIGTKCSAQESHLRPAAGSNPHTHIKFQQDGALVVQQLGYSNNPGRCHASPPGRHWTFSCLSQEDTRTLKRATGRRPPSSLTHGRVPHPDSAAGHVPLQPAVPLPR